MPRFWFIAEDDASSIQVQKDAFLLNWRKRNNEYPSYTEKMKPAFDSYLREFEQYITDDVGISNLSIGLCELTYVDVFESCEYWQGPQDTHKIISSFDLPEWGDSEFHSSEFNCEYSYKIGADINLKISIRSSKQGLNDQGPRLLIESKATGSPIENSMETIAADWYDRGHDVVRRWFLEVTNEQIRDQYWLPTDCDQ